MDVVLFGDQTADCQSFLKKSSRRKGCPLLSSFLKQAHVALQDEISSSPSSSRQHIPAFSTVSELAERYNAAAYSNLAVESAITCLAQLTHFIGFFEEHPDTYLKDSTTQVLGVCTGLLAASAIASSSSITSLLPLAIETVRIAFRVGRRVETIRNQLESQIEQNLSWSTIVIGISGETAEAALADFNANQTGDKVYLSAIGTMSVTVSGPPSVRKQLFEASIEFKSLQRREIPIRGPYHAPHLYDESDVERIIDPVLASCINQFSPLHNLVGLSSSTPVTSTLELFQQSIMEILARQVHWDDMIKECVSGLRSSTHSGVRVLAMGPTAVANSLISSLKIGGVLKLTLEDDVSWISNNTIPCSAKNYNNEAKIAIIGMAGRFPNAADHEAFWQLLERGMDVHREIPPDRFDAGAHTDSSGKGKNKSHTPYGCFIEQPGLFDPRFFNMSPREATQTDPMQRLALTTAYEAMEMAGFVTNRTPSTQAHRIATFYGQTSDDWREINAAQDIDTYFITGGVRAFGPGRINYHFGFSGPSFNIDTACSSSMAAIQLACTSLRAGDCDTVFAGGMNVMTNPDIFSGLSKGQFLSKTGSCKTYDNDADGYCRGDGVVTLILKRLGDAIVDKDPILGIIAGIATNHSAEAVSITHPHAGAQKFLFQKVMDEAGVDIRDVKYVEMHGTGTQAGDGVEMDSVSTVFAPRTQLRRQPEQPLFIGSVKSNIGHGEAVSGASALVKALMMFKKNMIPPHCGIKNKINAGFPTDLKQRGIHIAFEPTPFPRLVDSPRFIFVNNFSAAGGNTAMLLEDAPHRSPLRSDSRSNHVIVVSAKSLGSFRKNLDRLISWLENQTDAILPSLAYTTTARRSQFQYRLAVDGEDLNQIQRKLRLATETACAPVSSTHPDVGFIFTGQGSHYLGMGKQLFQDIATFRHEIEDYDQIAIRYGFPSFVGLIDGGTENLADVSPVVTQLAITCIQIALAQLWRSWGLEPSMVVGHSLGEYAALQVAGVLSICDTIYLVGHRAQLLVWKCTMGTHGMLAVRAGVSSLEHLLANSPIEIACLNGPEETVLSGPVDHIEQLKETLTAEGYKNTKLNVPYAFHSSQVESILEPFKSAARSIIFHAPQIPVISTLLGDVVEESGVFDAEYLSRHCRESVNFLGGVDAAMRRDIVDESTIWLEIGPHPVCTNMIKSIIGKDVIATPSLRRDEDAWKTTGRSLSTLFNSGLEIDWSEYHRDFTDAHEVVSLPSYSFDEKVYWIDYAENWCLTKGEKQQQIQLKPELLNTSIHRIIQETISIDSALVIGESDLADPLLRAAIEGHLVNGSPLCPSSIYADMAMTICDYAYRRLAPGAPAVHMNVAHMETHSPLVFSASGPGEQQILQIEAKVDVANERAFVTYRSMSATSKAIEQARCEVTFEDSAKWLKEWERRKFFVQARVDALIDGKGFHKIQRGLAYKLFSSLVDYDNKYRGMEEVILNSEGLEATASVVFQASSKDGTFYMSPYFIDSLAHLSGFIMNANDAVDSKSRVYISHGWETMRFAKTVDRNKQYRSYVKMQSVPGQGHMVAGDVYIFEGDEIIGVVGGVKFQGVPRTLLDTLLSSKKGHQPSASSTIPALQMKQASILQTGSKTSQTSPLTQETISNAASRLPALSSPQMTRKALDIIAQEVGCDISELADTIVFSDLGVDSLMSLSISGRFREELEIDFHSTLFNDLPTVGQLKNYFRQFDSMESSGPPTPGMVPGDSSDTDDESIELLEEDTEFDQNQGIIQLIRSTIAEEMGVSLEEIADNTDLATMGLDSLMSLSILGALREKTGLALHSDLLVQNTSVAKIENSLGLRTPKRVVTRAAPTGIAAGQLHTAIENITMGPLSSYPPAQSILLQGNPKTATHNLFLLPDGSGSATSYTTIPDVAPSSLCIYGLNCPFMKDPASFTIGVPGVTKIYMAEIKRRQPTGPYLLGGWSAGGVLAYEMTRQLLAKGEAVAKLVLIDSPCPLGLEALPSSFHRFCDQIGLLGDGNPGKIPSWLLPHFASSVRELTAYSQILDQLDEIDVSRMPATTAIWARDGIVKSSSDPKPEWDPAERMPNSMKWLVENRKNLGPNGWERLVGKNIKCVSTTGNHFTMMRKPITKDIATLVKRALDL